LAVRQLPLIVFRAHPCTHLRVRALRSSASPAV
jgi:hypothetical protein